MSLSGTVSTKTCETLVKLSKNMLLPLFFCCCVVAEIIDRAKREATCSS